MCRRRAGQALTSSCCRSLPPSRASPPRLLAPISPQHRNELIRHLAGWDYKPYALSQEDLFRCNCLMFEATLSIEGIWELDIDCGQSELEPVYALQALTRCYSWPTDQMKRFLFSIKALYNTVNPYHVSRRSSLLQPTRPPY